MKEKLIRILEIQDSFKSPFQFLFHGKRHIHVPFGIILSLIINFANICLTVTLFLQLINHTEPNVNYAKFSSSMTVNMSLNTKELLFTIAIRDKDYNIIDDPSYGYILPTYERTYSKDGNFEIEIVNLDFMNCSNVYPLFEELGVSDRFNSTGLINYNCYNFTEPIIIGGKYGTNFYANLDFYIMKCRNSSDSDIICKSEEEINSVMQNGWLQITYVSSYIDFNNYSNPIQYITEDSYINLDVSMNKQLYIYFSSLEIYSENNIIFSNRKKETSTKQDTTITDIISVLDDGVISSVMVCPSFSIEKYYRKYIKIQEIGASIGGLYSGLSLIVVIIYSYHKYKYTEMKIINELFAFGSEKIIYDKNSFFKPQPILNMKNNQSINDTNYVNPLFKNYPVNLITGGFKHVKDKNLKFHLPVRVRKNSFSLFDTQFNHMMYYKIDLGFINTMKLILCGCFTQVKNNYKEYKFALNELLKYIDYIEVSKFFMDVEKIKTILKSNNISEKWVSEKKLIAINSGMNNVKNMDLKKITINSTVLANSNFFFGGTEIKNSEINEQNKK